ARHTASSGPARFWNSADQSSPMSSAGARQSAVSPRAEARKLRMSCATRWRTSARTSQPGHGVGRPAWLGGMAAMMAAGWSRARPSSFTVSVSVVIIAPLSVLAVFNPAIGDHGVSRVMVTGSAGEDVAGLVDGRPADQRGQDPDAANPFGIYLERVGVQDHEIGELAGLERAELGLA